MRYLVFSLCLLMALSGVPGPAPGLASPAKAITVGPLVDFRLTMPVTDAASAPQVGAHAWLLYDPTSRQVLAERRGLVSLPPASTTKILTCLIVLETCEPTDEVTISAGAARTGGASVGLRRGQRFEVRELLYGLMLQSGNDAAVALAEHVAGSVAEFSKLMNARARELGALSSNFVNPHGLTAPGHRSTAYDLAVIAAAALRLPEFRALVASREHEIGSLDPAWTSLVRNTNQLLWSYAGADGVKTGTTNDAGECLVASATRDGRQLISVVLRSRHRWGDSARLLTFGFEGTALNLAGRRGDPGPAVLVADPVRPVWWSTGLPLQVRVPLALGDDLAYVSPGRDPVAMTVTHALAPGLTLPLAAGEIVGVAAAYHDGRLVATAPLVVLSPVPRGLLYARGVEALARAVRAALRQGLP
jgi:D-alanyl-D-alanine carboxypeptidase (penicillin-binding protein 5/6)